MPKGKKSKGVWSPPPDVPLKNDRLLNAIDEDKVKSDASVLKLLTKLKKSTQPYLGIIDFGAKHVFDATDALLSAYENGDVSIAQLRSILTKPVQYVWIYTKITSDSSAEWHGNTELSHSRFIGLISTLTKHITGELTHRKFATLPIFQGRTVEYWITGDRVPKSPDHVAEVVENAVADNYYRQLRRHPPFREHWKKVCDVVEGLLESVKLPSYDSEMSSWIYDYWENMIVVNHQHFVDITKENEAILWPPRSFCEQWCLEQVGRSDGSESGMDFTPMHVKVKRHKRGIGWDVFIPQYYKFTNIKTYHTRDFAGLKSAMEEKWEGRFQMGQSLSKKELVAQAKAMRKEFRLEGCSPADAWEKTRKIMAWSESTMAKYLGEKPFSDKEYLKG